MSNEYTVENLTKALESATKQTGDYAANLQKKVPKELSVEDFKNKIIEYQSRVTAEAIFKFVEAKIKYEVQRINTTTPR